MEEASRHTPVIEENSIGFVPLSERHGHYRDLFTLWFTTNIAPLPIVTGAMAIQVFDLPLLWGFTAIIAGNLVGALVLAACSAQGPQMGLAQMIQSRGQFGRYGALLVVGFATLLYLGFFTSNIVLAARSVHSLTNLNFSIGAVLSALGAAVIAILGYKTIHLLNRIGMWFMGVGLLMAAVSLVMSLPSTLLFSGEVTAFGWLAMFSLSAVWHVSYSCYTSDYSRYLPPEVGFRGPFLASFLGASLGTAASFCLGAVAVAGAPEGSDAMAMVSASVGILSPVLLLLFVLNIITHNALNIYGAVLSLITIIQTFAASWSPQRRARIILSVLVLLSCLGAATFAAESFVPHFITFVIGLMVVLSPWATINIIDFYVIQKGRYDIDSFFRPDGGIYGLFEMRAVIAYVMGIVVQIPFFVSDYYTGPIATAIGGLDIGWMVAPLVTGTIFYLLKRNNRTALPSAASITR